MDSQKDFCPVNESGHHRYFIAKTAEVFVPHQFSFSEHENVETINLIQKLPNLYEKKVLVISGCNCGSALSELVEVGNANH